MYILIGSRALNYWIPSHKISNETDWDIVGLLPISGAEWHDQYLLNNDDIYHYTNPSDTLTFGGKIVHVASLKCLSMIKRSHLHRDLGFDKHITQYWRNLESQRHLYDSHDLEFLQIRKEMTIDRYPQAKPNLNQSIESFFDDAVIKKYNHDYLHELFAHEEFPMYTKMQRDVSLAWCHEDLWDKLTYQQKAECVAEEVYVIATERFMVPNEWQFQSKLAFMKALQKVCTTLCSGWFRDFAIDNYPSIVKLYDKNKFVLVKEALVGV